MKLIKTVKSFFKIRRAKAVGAYSETIPILNLDVIDSCNSKCVTCDIWKNQGKGELSLEEYSKILLDAKALDTQIVSIGGGEPLIRKNIIPLIRLIRDNGFSLHMNTSLVGVNHVYLSQIIDAGMRNFHVSLDHIDKEHYRDIRGVDAFDLVQDNIEYLLSNKDVFVGINVVVSRHNFLDLESITDWLIGKRVHQVQFIMAANNLQQKEKIDDFSISIKEIPGIRKNLLFCRKKLKQFGIETNSKQYIDDLNYAFIKERKNPCFVGRANVTVDSYGNVLPCYEYTSYLNVRKKSLFEIIKSKEYHLALTKVDQCQKACHDVGSAELNLRMTWLYNLKNFSKSLSEIKRFK